MEVMEGVKRERERQKMYFETEKVVQFFRVIIFCCEREREQRIRSRRSFLGEKLGNTQGFYRLLYILRIFPCVMIKGPSLIRAAWLLVAAAALICFCAFHSALQHLRVLYVCSTLSYNAV